jgi:phosphate/sulfate permease
MDERIPLVLAGVLTFVFGWNNSSILTGNSRGSGTLSMSESTVLCSIGMILGVAIEGSKMDKSLGSLVATQPTETMVAVTLASSIILTLGLTLVRIPVTFSITMVGAFAGTAIALSEQLRLGDLATILAFWAVAPLATMAITFVSYRLIHRLTLDLSLVSIDAFNRAGVGIVSVALAYVLSANNVGMIYGTAVSAAQPNGSPLPAVLLLGAVAIAGMIAFGREGVAETVGDRLLSLTPQGVLAAFVGTIVMMWAATQLAIPISVTQCLLGGMFGAAFTKRVAIINRRVALELVASWALVPLAALLLAFALILL